MTAPFVFWLFFGGMTQRNEDCAEHARLKVCDACGATFECARAAGPCWCEGMALTAGMRAALSAKFRECLCPACLAMASRGEMPGDRASYSNPTVPRRVS